jgi:hypothetical protein
MYCSAGLPGQGDHLARAKGTLVHTSSDFVLDLLVELGQDWVLSEWKSVPVHLHFLSTSFLMVLALVESIPVVVYWR